MLHTEPHADNDRESVRKREELGEGARERLGTVPRKAQLPPID